MQFSSSPSRSSTSRRAHRGRAARVGISETMAGDRLSKTARRARVSRGSSADGPPSRTSAAPPSRTSAAAAAIGLCGLVSRFRRSGRCASSSAPRNGPSGPALRQPSRLPLAIIPVLLHRGRCITERQLRDHRGDRGLACAAVAFVAGARRHRPALVHRRSGLGQSHARPRLRRPLSRPRRLAWPSRRCVSPPRPMSAPISPTRRRWSVSCAPASSARTNAPPSKPPSPTPAPAPTRSPPADMFTLIEQLFAERGWDVRTKRTPLNALDTGQLNAVATTLLGWRQEVVARVTGSAAGSTVAMRSASLTAFHDFAENGLRIEAFLARPRQPRHPNAPRRPTGARRRDRRLAALRSSPPTREVAEARGAIAVPSRSVGKGRKPLGGRRHRPGLHPNHPRSPVSPRAPPDTHMRLERQPRRQSAAPARTPNDDRTRNRSPMLRAPAFTACTICRLRSASDAPAAPAHSAARSRSARHAPADNAHKAPRSPSPAMRDSPPSIRPAAPPASSSTP